MYNYMYEDGRLTYACESDVQFSEYNYVTKKIPCYVIRYFYDTEGNLATKRTVFADGKEQTVTYETAENETQLVKTLIGEHSFVSVAKTDSFGRKEFDEIGLSKCSVTRKFDYLKGQATEEHIENGKYKSVPTTQLVSQIVLSNGLTLSYGYDEEERITSVTETRTISGVPTTSTTLYTYDALGQLVTETKDGQIVNEMTYDNYGNIKTKNGVQYVYDSIWRDKLICYDGQEITYDNQGNPTEYLGHNLTWEKGRQLKSFEKIKDDGTKQVISYTYNANGIRTSKTVDGIRHDYTLDGAKILRETWTECEIENTLIPLYDNEDSVCGIIYNGTPYYFLKNQQGDVIVITDSKGDEVAKYSYDAWGKVLSVRDTDDAEITSESHIANINPFRYRSYYFDRETNLYYLQSRYYDAEVGRFVNGDEAEIILKLDGYHEALNYYSYCCCNPVNNIDQEGQWRMPKLVAYGIQLEGNISVFTFGIEIVFANGNIYLFDYNGASVSNSTKKAIEWIKLNLLTSFTKKAFKSSFKKLASASLSLCVFAVFSSTTSKFSANKYKGPFVGTSSVFPTIYGVAVKSYFSTYSTYTCIGIGFSYPNTFDISFARTRYQYRGKINISSKIKSFVNKNTKGLKAS